MTGVCDVCMLVDGDKSPKEVKCCPLCSANLCATCSRAPMRRAKAWLLRGARGLPKRRCE